MGTSTSSGSHHSVEKHLEVSPEDYDIEIRRFVPGYEAMLSEVIGALKEHLPMGVPVKVIDLGAGTGALSEQILHQLTDVEMLLLDADAEMLAKAESRLGVSAALRVRASLMHGSFTDALPRVDAAVASLSLHHVHERSDKIAVYQNILSSLRAGGVLINADATMPESASLAGPLRRRWAAHLVANGDTESQAFERFAQWAIEDRYYGLDEELDMLKEAGFTELDIRWRQGPTTVIVARKSDT
jgi:tRNA (cmo5U34)-methyltransferase